MVAGKPASTRSSLLDLEPRPAPKDGVRGGARELGQNAVAGRVGDPAAVLGDEAVHGAGARIPLSPWLIRQGKPTTSAAKIAVSAPLPVQRLSCRRYGSSEEAGGPRIG